MAAVSRQSTFGHLKQQQEQLQATSTATKPALGYWDNRGIAEPIRLLLQYVGVEFDDVRFDVGPPPAYDKSDWLLVKDHLGLSAPNLPYWIEPGGLRLPQSHAITLYLALKHGVDGEVLESLLNAPAAELKLLGEGPGAACQAASIIAGYGARCKLHTRLKEYVEGHKKSLKAVEDARAALQLDADGREQLSRLAGIEPAYELLDPSLRVSKPVKSEKTRQVVVPVYLSLIHI